MGAVVRDSAVDDKLPIIRTSMECRKCGESQLEVAGGIRIRRTVI